MKRVPQASPASLAGSHRAGAARRRWAGLGGRIGACVVAVQLVLCTSCSWLFVNKPPPLPVETAPPVACTSSVAAPVADTVSAVLLAALGSTTVYVGAQSKNCTTSLCQPAICLSDYCPPQPCTTCSGWSPAEQTYIIVSGVALLGLATMFGFSAAHGYSTTARCRELEQAQAACLTGVESACQSLRVGATPASLGPTPTLKPGP